MPSRILIYLQPSEREALISLAETENRDPRVQAALIIREKLIDQGYLEGTSICALAQLERMMEKLSSEVSDDHIE